MRHARRAVAIATNRCQRGEVADCSSLYGLYKQGYPVAKQAVMMGLERMCSLDKNCSLLAMAYQDGEMTPKDPQAAIKAYQTGCDGLNVIACFSVVELLRQAGRSDEAEVFVTRTCELDSYWCGLLTPQSP